MDYVAYHSQELMGRELGEGPPFGMLSRKPVNHLAGQTIWVIEGRGKKKRYFLKQRFQVEMVEPIDDDYFRYAYSSSTGVNFLPEISLSAEPWFPGFLKSVANFSLGVTRLQSEYIARFQDLTKSTAASTNARDEADWQLTEGEIVVSLRSFRSRSSAARAACIEALGSRCTVCGFDFGQTYGPECEGFIEVHHREMLASCDGARVVDPIQDLIPLCPNCHRAIHLLDVSVAELMRRIRRE